MENGNNKIPSDPEQKKTNSGGWERFLGGGDKASGADPVQGRAEQDPAAEAEDDALSFEKKEAERKNNSIGCVSTISYVIFVLGISIILSVFVILSVNDMFSFVKADKTAEITITDGESLRDVSKVLSKAGIIKYPSLFSTFAKLTDMDDDIAPGTYTLNASMDYRTILSNIRYKSAGKATVTITIPEGMEQDKIFALLEENGVCELWRLQAYARYYDFDYSFIKGLPYTPNRLEGYLFPDTYTFYVDDSPSRVLKKFLSNFNKKWSVEMKARLENINMSMNDIVIIASMIEKEAKFDEERPTIASVIYNRLQSSNFPRLEIDATVLYAIGGHKDTITDEDKKVDSPYNTYVCEGLPAGPICNPGLAAITAALNPEDTGYYYYVARKNGYHFFSKTYAEHQRMITEANNETFEDTVSTTSPSIEG